MIDTVATIILEKRPGTWRRGWLIAFLLLTLTIPSSMTRPVRADSAPMWPSPIGLTPGYPGTSVRMASETVMIRVVERDGVAYALVDADFDLLNAGPDVQMNVGFPAYAASVLSLDPGDSYSPIAFSPDLDKLTARSADREFHATRQTVTLGSSNPYATEWYVWEMAFPGGQPVHLTVTYEQRLTWEWEQQPVFAQPMYVLRTGALWDGPIGEATISMIAPDGGVFLGGPELAVGPYGTLPPEGEVLGPDQAATASVTRIVWHLRDFEPRQDVGALYVYADAWRVLAEGEEALRTSATDVSFFTQAGRMALRLTGSEDGWPWGPFGAPKATLDRSYQYRARDFASRAVALAPDQAEPWELLGDVETWFARPDRKHLGELACWPDDAVAGYQRAGERGSATAAGKMVNLEHARSATVELGSPEPEPCP